MKKLIFILKTLCVCLCVSSLILMVDVANLDTITKRDLFFYSACGIIAVATFVSFKLLGKVEGGSKMIVQELEIPLSQVTLQDCIDMMFFRGKSAILDNGNLTGFEKEPYIQEIIGGRA